MSTQTKRGVMSITILIFGMITACLFTGCDLNDNTTMSGSEDGISLSFDAMLYDNEGNNYVTFRGNEFNISPNKVEQYGYDTTGTLTSYYETSSVVSIEIDGHDIQNCGSTVLFKDTRLKITPIEIDTKLLDNPDKSGYTDNTQISSDTYATLSKWYLSTHETKDCKEELILIQSQDGYNIGVVECNRVDWSVAEKLPKTTLLTIDGKELYIHRCNFTIIDTALFSQAVEPE